MINADKKSLWDNDVLRSVDLYNRWFLEFAPKAFRETRAPLAAKVEDAIAVTNNLNELTADVLKAHPHILQTLRMCCCPPIARERLSGLAGVSLTLVKTLEDGNVPPRMKLAELNEGLEKILSVLRQMLDDELSPWLKTRKTPVEAERHRTATVIADRLCGSIADPIIRNAQEERQLLEISNFLKAKKYQEIRPNGAPTTMQPATFAYRVNVLVQTSGEAVTIPIDAMIQPRTLRPSKLPIMIECKSAGDFTNVNKRRKEEGQKGRQLRSEFGGDLCYLLFLCGYFGRKYLQYEADENFDWVWEHRISDLDQLGLD